MTMKNKLKEEMLEAIFVQTGGRPENPKIVEVCAEIAIKAISSNTMFAVSLPSDFLNNNRIEVVWDLSQQYLCYINYKEGDGAYGLGMTFLEALQNGIEKYKERGNVL